MLVLDDPKQWHPSPCTSLLEAAEGSDYSVAAGTSPITSILDLARRLHHGDTELRFSELGDIKRYIACRCCE